jgi:hypothetical protein
MLKWLTEIGKKADHPMYNVEEARRLLRDLPADPSKALEELSSWLESVAAAEGYAPAQRIGVVKLLDETAQERAPVVLGQFLHPAQLKEFDRLGLWQALVGFWEHLCTAYRRCLQDIARPAEAAGDHPEGALLLARALRALASETKVLHLRYLPVPPRIWTALAELYALSEQARVEEAVSKAYAADAAPTTPRREFLKALMLEAACPQSEPPAAVELCSRIIARFASGFILQREPAPGCHFCFDLAHPGPPVRHSPKIAARDSLRYFGAGKAAAALQDALDHYTAHPDEADRRFGEEYSAGDKTMAMKHLLRHWGESAPRRRGPRVAIEARARIAHGFESVAELVTRIDFSGMAQMTPEQRLKVKQQTGIALQPQDVTAAITQWTERDASAWGLGVDIPREDEPWASVGTLLAVQPSEQGSWWVGAIRRMYRDPQGRLHAGIEILAKKPLSVYLRGVGKEAERADNWQSSSGSFRFTYLNAIILGEGASGATRRELLLKRDGFAPGVLYEVMIGERSPYVRLEELLERGADYDRVRVSWLEAPA